MRLRLRRHDALAFALAFTLATAATGCLADLEPDVGPPTHEVCSDQDSDPDHTVSFSHQINEAILSAARPTACINCHDPASSSRIGFEISGLDLSSYGTLRRGGAISGARIVVPGSPCQSLLYLKVHEGPPFGSRMPFNGPPYLDDDQIERIHDWIAEGALAN